MSPWGTLDDQELIAYDDEDADVEPLWAGYNDREEMTPVEIVNALTGRLG